MLKTALTEENAPSLIATKPLCTESAEVE